MILQILELFLDLPNTGDYNGFTTDILKVKIICFRLHLAGLKPSKIYWNIGWFIIVF
jgi:hypothetical protein